MYDKLNYLRACLLLAAVFLLANNVRAQQKNLQAVSRQINTEFHQQKISIDQKVLYEFYAFYKPEQLPARFSLISSQKDSGPAKCGTPLMIEAYEHRHELSASTKQKLKNIRQKDNSKLNQTYVSDSGKFTLHYAISGENAVPSVDGNQNGVPDYVEKVGAAADSSYHYEVQTLGYSDPIPSGKTYRIEVKNLKIIYGQTVPDNENETTFMQVENDFAENFPPNDDPDNQAGDIKVTVAHEFKHAIQFVDNGFSGETDNWAEMDAVRMEEVVYDKVNDYYNYLSNNNSIFLSPSRSFYPGSYYQVTWALYFEQKYGHQFWVKVWNRIHKNPNITMIHALTKQLGDKQKFSRNFSESELWHYASGKNMFMNYGFDEANNYPDPAIKHKLKVTNQSPSNLILTDSIPGFAANYNDFIPNEPKEGNLMINLSSDGPMSGVGLLVRFNDGGFDSDVIPANAQNSSIHNQTIRTEWKWNNIQKVGVIVANSSRDTSEYYSLRFYSKVPQEVRLDQNYPNPFSPAEGTEIPYKLMEASHVKINVYDITGRLIATPVDEHESSGTHKIAFKGKHLSSGVYIYQLITDKKTTTKKMTLIR